MKETKLDDPDRLSERIWTEYRDVIYDKESFDRAYDDYMSTDLTIAQDVALRKATYEKTTPKISRISEKERALKKQQLMVSGISKLPKGKHQYIGQGKVNGQIVFIYQANITIRGKQVIRYRDRRGRFAKRI